MKLAGKFSVNFPAELVINRSYTNLPTGIVSISLDGIDTSILVGEVYGIVLEISVSLDPTVF